VLEKTGHRANRSNGTGIHKTGAGSMMPRLGNKNNPSKNGLKEKGGTKGVYEPMKNHKRVT